jgi:hypothetical protein
MTRVVARVWILRRPGFFDASETWYVQRGGVYADCGAGAKRGAHEYVARAAAERARDTTFPNYAVWRRGRRVK